MLAFAPATAAAAPGPELLGRVILPSNAYQPGPPSGAAISGDLNGVTTPFRGQPIPGFSAVLDAGHGQLLAMPDNGYGAKGNSADFLLRLYRLRPDFMAGDVDVLGFIGLHDPDRRIPFALTRPDRVLTGADFDLESVRRAKDGTLWFGEEFGPFLLHTDANGRVLEAPIELPGVRSPQNPYLPAPDAWNLPGSRGFEGMAMSPDGRRLYPVLEGALRGDTDPRRRVVFEFDIRARRYTGRSWTYRTDAAFPNAVIGDFTAVDGRRLVAIERDDAQGADARQKKIYAVDLRRTAAPGALQKRLVLDLLRIPDPSGVSLPARAGEYGVGTMFSFPLQSVESLEVLGRERLLIANDNNYPFSDGRWIARDRPDDTELVVVRAPALRGGQELRGGGDRGADATTLAVIGDTPYGADQAARFDQLIARINADPKVRAVVHVGDIKNGSTVCSDDYFAFIRDAFETFEDPVLYTPGDNEWTDCHRANNGAYVPTERLAALRERFFAGDLPGRRGKRVVTQAAEGFPENAQWMESRVVFATAHVVGSDNGVAPWFGGAETPAQQAERLAEVVARTSATVAWIDAAFDRAHARDAEGVALFMQADTYTGAAAPNLTRVVVEGETVDEHLRLTVDPRASELFRWQRVRVTP